MISQIWSELAANVFRYLHIFYRRCDKIITYTLSTQHSDEKVKWSRKMKVDIHQSVPYKSQLPDYLHQCSRFFLIKDTILQIWWIKDEALTLMRAASHPESKAWTKLLLFLHIGYFPTLLSHRRRKSIFIRQITSSQRSEFTLNDVKMMIYAEIGYAVSALTAM